MIAYNKTLAYEDLALAEIRPTARDLQRWVRRWFLRGYRLGVNGNPRWRVHIRRQKMWEYARALALTGASAPARAPGTRYHVLDVGGALTLPVFYLADQGDHVVTLDIAERLVRETQRVARRSRLDVDARVLDLVHEDPTPADLGVAGGFDRVYCLCVIEHIRPPGQQRVAERMARLLRPGGQLALTFDYGENARSEAPLHHADHVRALRDAIGLPLLGNDGFEDDGRRYSISRRHPHRLFTFGSLFFEKPLPPERCGS